MFASLMAEPLSALAPDPLATLRAYRPLAPWNLRDLAGHAGIILQAAGVRPTNPAATTAPGERTIRYYVSRGLVSAPNGRGTSATYGYRHLLEVLWVKLRQMQGASLELIADELRQQTGDQIERRVAASLGHGLPAPARSRPAALAADEPAAGAWYRVPIADGVELMVSAAHPAAAERDALARRVRDALRANRPYSGVLP
jgi:DNA-binding transcriptional MerR regulator